MALIKFLTLALICLFAGNTIAEPAKVNINWSNPDDYRDIQKSAGESEQTFRERIASNIQAHMDKLAAGLPEDSTLNMNVTNLTLAGTCVPVAQVVPTRMSGLWKMDTGLA